MPQHKPVRLVLFLALGMCCVALFTPALADEPKQSLDAQLLDDLDSELLDDLKNLPPIAPKEETPPDKNPSLPKDDANRKEDEEKENGDAKLEPIGAGEDVELGKATDPLTRIGQRMRTAKHLIDRRNTSTQTQQLQDEILNDLSALIAKLQSQQQRTSGSKQAGDQGGQFRPGAGDGSAEGQLDKGPEKSTDRLGNAETTLTALQRQRELLRRMNWGSLPDRLRNQVRSARVEQFLPKYARLIEQYYKRLAEESQFQP